MVGARLDVCAVTVIANGTSVALAAPSVARIWMLLVVPTSPAAGVPDRRPVPMSNAAQPGAPVTVKVNTSPSASCAVGVNEYAPPASTDEAGVPEIVGGLFGTSTTRVNGARLAASCPSLTEIVMFAYVPALVTAGVPESRPVVALKLAQGGRFAIVYDNALPSGSLADGVKLYAVPATAVVAGVPEICGARLVGEGLMTVRSNGGS